MTDSNHKNLRTECKDIDGISPIRWEAWKLQQPLPTTSGHQQKTGGYPFQHQNIPPLPPVQHQPGNNFGSMYGISPPAQSHHTHFGNVQHGGNHPVMVPIYWYYPCCQRCQQFVNPYFQ